jgi:hypothetical protein
VAEITALIDANVFYAMSTTDIIMETAKAGHFRARWSDDIHDEWTRNLLKNDPSRTSQALLRRRRAMDATIRDALVTGYDALIPTLSLPDPGDRHVLAAAIVGRCDAIVTLNLRHFPAQDLAAHNIAIVHPDTFLVERFQADNTAFLGCVRTCRERMKNPPRTVDEHLDRMLKAGLPLLVGALSQHKGLL